MENDARADAYEALRDRNVLEIEKRKEELRLQTCATDLVKTCQPKKRGSKRKRKTPPDATERRTSARLMALDKEVPTDTPAEDEAADVHLNANEGEEKEVRKITTMKSIWGRQNKPKLKLEINEIGQPIGASATRFANFIGTQVRTNGFPVAYDDWRKVPLSLKLGLWTEVKLFWDVDQGVFEWYMKTSHIKWKEFKADLKKDYFDNELEYEELEYNALIKSCDDRVDPDQWRGLVDHWMTPEAKARSIRGKTNRAKHKQAHTAGCKSFARVDEEMTEEHGRRPRRDELFIKTHTDTKTGVPHKESTAIIQKLREKAENFPELLEKSMKEGDLFSHVCGAEKHGYVRTKGLGATPSGLELPGVWTYKSTKLQIEIEARCLADQKVDDMSEEMEKMKREMAEMKQMILGPRDSRNTIPHQNTSSPQDNNEEVGNLYDEVESNGSMNSMQNRHGVTDIRRITPNLRQQDQEQQMNIRAQEGARKTIGRQVVDDEVESSAPVRREFPPQRQNNKLGGGREVVLYSISRPFNVPVAKGFFQTLDSHALVGGVPLGPQYSEVVVSSVYKIDIVLPRPYEDVVNMGSARGRSIA